VKAAKDIKKGEVILNVPYKLILTFDEVSDTAIGKQMLEKNMDKRYGKSIFFC